MGTLSPPLGCPTQRRHVPPRDAFSLSARKQRARTLPPCAAAGGNCLADRRANPASLGSLPSAPPLPVHQTGVVGTEVMVWGIRSRSARLRGAHGAAWHHPKGALVLSHTLRVRSGTK